MFTNQLPVEVFQTHKEFIRIMEPPRDFVFWSELMQEETAELIQADTGKEGMEQIFKELADVIYVTAGFYNTMPVNAMELLDDEMNALVEGRFVAACNAVAEICHKYQIPVPLAVEAFHLIHQSNLSKLDDDGLPIRSDGTDGNPEGKILKGPNYQPPNMAPVVMKWSKFKESLQDADQKGQ